VVTSTSVRRGSELSVEELYSLLRLRVEVFIVEQHITYLDLDGLDLLPSTHHFWLRDDAEVVSCLRVAAEGNDRRIGRVCTKREHRGKGFSRVLMRAAIAASRERTLVLDAQPHVVDFYRRFDFVINGPVFLDAGIPHTPMRREGNQ
jgi:ElaA protein